MYDNLEIDLCMIGRTSFDWDDALNHWFVVREKNNQLASINILKLPISRIEQYEILKTLLDNEDRSMIDLPK